MAKQIMVLNVSQQSGGTNMVRFLMWFAIASGKELPAPGFVSQWADIASKDAQLLTDIRAGKFVEESSVFELPTSLTLAQVQTVLQAAWNSRNTYLSGVVAPGELYGRFWDGAAWAKA